MFKLVYVQIEIVGKVFCSFKGMCMFVCVCVRNEECFRDAIDFGVFFFDLHISSMSLACLFHPNPLLNTFCRKHRVSPVRRVRCGLVVSSDWFV